MDKSRDHKDCNDIEMHHTGVKQSEPGPLSSLWQLVSKVENPQQVQKKAAQTVTKRTKILIVEPALHNSFVKKDAVPVETDKMVKEEPHDLPIAPVIQDGCHIVSEHCHGLDNVKIKQEPLKSLEQLVEDPFQNIQENTAHSSQFLKEETPDSESTPHNSNISEHLSVQVKVEMDDFLILRRKALNHIELRHKLSFNLSGDVAHYSAYYANIINTLEDVTKKSLIYANRGDKIQLELRNPNLKSCVSVILCDENDLSSLRALLDQLGHANTFVNELEMVVQIVQVPHGGTGVKRPLEETLDCEWIQKKRRYLHLVNNPGNQLCFAISLAHILHPDANDHQAASLGAEMQQQAGLTDQTPVTFGDVTKFEKLLNRKIVVFYHEGNFKKLSKFMTPFENKESVLYVYFYRNHYFGIRNLTGFLGDNYFCELCYKSYKNPRCLACTNHCLVCLDPDCDETENMMYCKDCNRNCRSSYCFEAHKKPKWRPKVKVNLSECDMRKKCKKCSTVFHILLTKMDDVHMRFLSCTNCGEKLDKDEHNYIQPLASAENHSETNLIFYEFKTFVDESGQNVPFVLSTKSIQGETWSSYGELCIIDFLLHFRCTTFSNSIFIAHNIDSSIILNTMTDMGVKPKVIAQTGKIVCIEDPDYILSFIDSASFLPMPLVGLPEIFGVSSSKGFFPVNFISKANLEYIGPCPPPEFYEVQQMDQKKREEFETAYQVARICDFDFKREAKVYCEEDTNILAITCLNFRRYLINRYDVDPFRCATLPSFGMTVFLTKFLAPNTLALSQLDDYKPHVTTSSPASIEWLEWLMFSENIFIQHALNNGVKNICNIYVDGYSDDSDQNQLGTVLEFITCLENGCPTCYPVINQFKQRHERRQEKLRKLQSLRYKLVVMREHTWKEMKKSNKELQEFLKHYKPPQPLTPQEALYGNLNCAVKLQHSATSGEKIHFAQVNSLFPHVMMNNYYPLGQPKLIFDKFDDFPNYFGLIKAVVYPPRELYFPVLPYKNANGKVVYTLCRSCTNVHHQQGPCVHNDKERALTGVWVTPEFNAALKMGYKVGKILEVWHFEKKSKTIFNDYVKSLVKEKQESLGYPPDVKDSITQEMYVKEFQAKHGILLDKDRIKLNLAKRHAFDCCLDKLWQEFGDRSVQINTEIVTKNAEMVKYMFSGMYHLKYFTVLSNKAALIQWTSNNNKKQLPKNNDNIFVTAFTAAYGRLFLYKILQKLEERVLYYDTESIFYVAKNGQTEFEFGRYLGQLTDKLAGDSILEFASFGPKNYAYQTKTNRVVLNVKGIMQVVENCGKIDFNSVKEMVEGYIAYRNENESERIEPQHKVLYDTRQLLPNGQTLPFGY